MWPPPPPIPPVEDGLPRPFWSVVIPTHNCARYLEETLRSVLSQDPGPQCMQLVVVDDASSDGPEEVVQRLAPGRVEFYRNPEALGAPNNFNRCVSLARGRWVHILHGDDAVRPGFYQRFEQVIASQPHIVALFCRAVFVNADSHWIGISDLDLPSAQIYPELFPTLVLGNRVWTPTIVVARQVYEQVGGFRPQLPHCCDWDMWKRVARLGPVWFEPEPLALYRVHGFSDSAKLARAAHNIADMRRAVALSATYLEGKDQRLLTRARKRVAEIALVSARQALDAGQLRTAWAHLREAVLAAPYPTTAINAALTTLASLIRRALRPQHRL